VKQNSVLISFFVVLISTGVLGQTRKVNQLPNFDKHLIHWGFYLGMNHRDFKVDYQQSNYPNTSIVFDNQIGFNVGLIGNLRINDYFNLRLEPGLFSNSGTIYFENTPTNMITEAEISSTYLHLPLLLKISSNRLNNTRPYLIGGFSYDHNFSSNQKNSDDNSNGEFRMKTSNFMYEIGFGVDFYFHYFKFSPSIRGQFAMTNELLYDEDPDSPYTSPIKFMGTRGVFLKVTFE